MQLESPLQNLQPQRSEARFDVSGKLILPETQKEASVEVVWVPTQQVLLTSVVVPGKRKSDWMKAMPYALEEEISQSIEDVFIAVFHRDPSGSNAGLTWVAVVSKKLMADWVETLASAGLSKAQLVPDCFQCPFPEENDKPSVGHYIETDSHRLARTGRWTGMAIPHDWMSLAPFKNMAWQAETPLPISADHFKVYGLRQGKYQPFSQSNAWIKNWATVAGVFGVLFALLVAQNWIEAHQKTVEKQQVTEATERLFKKMFPDVKRIVNLTAQAKTALAKQPSDTSLVGPARLAILIEPAFKKMPQIEITAFKWQNQHLTLSLEAADNEALQALTDALKDKVTLTLKINSMQPNQVQAEMKIDGVR